MKTSTIYIALCSLVILIALICSWQFLRRQPISNLPLPVAPQAGVQTGGINLVEHFEHELASVVVPGKVEPSTLVIRSDGKSVLVGCADGSVRTWDFASDQLHLLLPAHGDRMRERPIAFSPDKSTVADADAWGTATIWNVWTKEPTKRFKGENKAVTALQFAPAGSVLAVGDEDGRILLWDVTAGKQVCNLRRHSGLILALAFSTDGSLFAAAAKDGGVSIWDVASRKRLVDLERTDTTYGGVITFLGNTTTVVYWTQSQSLGLWDARSGKLLGSLPDSVSWGQYLPLACTNDGKTLASAGSYPKLKFWDVASRRALASYDVGNSACRGVAFTPDGTRVVTAGYMGTESDDKDYDPVLKIWEVPQAGGRRQSD